MKNRGNGLTYRVVQMADGRWKCQYRFAFFWWIDSAHVPSRDRVEQVRFALGIV